MSQVNLDRLILKLSGIDPASGKPIGRRLAQKLAAANLDLRASGRVEQIRISVTARDGEAEDQLAERMAAEVLRNLEKIV